MATAVHAASKRQQVEWLALEDAVKRADHQTFACLVRAMDWSVYRPNDLTCAIDMALQLDMVPLARELAQQGSRLFPEESHIQQAAAVLSPPVAMATPSPRRLPLAASQTWLKAHASQYKGQWVAVCDGTLLGTAPTLPELYNQLKLEGKMMHTVIVKVLP